MIPENHVILPRELYQVLLAAYVTQIESRNRPPTTPNPLPPGPGVVVSPPASNTVAVNHSLGGENSPPFGVPEGYTSTGADENKARTLTESE